MFGQSEQDQQGGGILDAIRQAGGQIIRAGGEAIGNVGRAYADLVAQQIRNAAQRNVDGITGQPTTPPPASTPEPAAVDDGLIFGVERKTALVIGGVLVIAAVFALRR